MCCGAKDKDGLSKLWKPEVTMGVSMGLLWPTLGVI